MLVKIRKEQNYFIVYFIELRRMLCVNDLGAKIIDDFFNKNFKIKTIAQNIYKNKKNQEYVVSDFLEQIKKELLNDYQGGYPVVEKEKMDVPIAVELQVISKCNLRCKHCCQNEYFKTMPINKIKSILEILYKKNVFEINLVGGEFFLHPNFFEILLLCKKYNFVVNIITNGTLLNKSLIKKISKFKNIVFLISLEGIGKTNDKIRGKGVFKKVDNNIKELIKNGFHLEISTTISKNNIDKYQEIIDYSNFLGVACNFNLFKPFKKSHKSLIIKPDEYFKFILDVFEQRIKKDIKVGLTNAAIIAFLYKKVRNECRATMSGLTINVDGYMVPCPFLKLAGYYKDEKLPKFNENFLKVWNDNYFFNKFRRGNLSECQACNYIFNKNIHKNSPYGILAFKKWFLKNKQKFVY